MYKKLGNLQGRKQETQRKKQVKAMSRHIHKRKSKKRYSKSLPIREMQIKTIT